MKADGNQPQFLVAHIGARRSYAVAQALEDSGMLAALYTDVCADAGIGKNISWFANLIDRGFLKRIKGRKVPEKVLPKTRSFSWPAISYELERRLAGADQLRESRALSRFGRRLGMSMSRAGFEEATHLYTMLGDVTPLLEEARRKGIVTVTEIYIILSAERRIELERQKYPGFESPPASKVMDEAFSWLRKVIRLSDWFVVPSDAVRDDLVENFNVDSDRCLLVPYAASDPWYGVDNDPVPGRILFVGTAGMRKGIHILGRAAETLDQDLFSFHVAGDVSKAVLEHPMTTALNFLGRVPRTEIEKEYIQADIIVLPSLAEGSAEVLYEALAVGIPVITTREAGSVVRDDIEGFIIPASDHVTLAMRIRHLVEDRDVRNRMASAAKKRGRQFTWETYSTRLCEALSRIPTER